MNESLDNAQPTIKINGVLHAVNIKEYETFVEECQVFMDVEGNGFEVMTQIISDQLVECASPQTTIEELRPQLKFLKELGLLLSGLTTPLGDN
ncbi:MAG TPA: hypothetical protein VK541_03055 [Pedobacter sp.]|uniref:hypothetical protein n=1 Tax=Pedobacter sp. TaxID=1411316 RepID=UPI002C67E0F0|nr:hypothetical protein [Pedobacter sp.]HMI01429.1 hypothetical protein [Pedobacter sp.]